MVSVSLEYPNMLKDLPENSFRQKSHRESLTLHQLKKKHMQELYKKRESAVEEIDLAPKILTWFKNLDSTERSRIMTHKNPVISLILHEMHIHKKEKGQKLFSLNPFNSKTASPEILSLFSTRPKSLLELSSQDHALEKRFEDFLRFCDNEAYCDSLSLDQKFTSNEFLQLLKSVSNSKSFLIPCRVSWENSMNAWVWDYPMWLVPGEYYSLAAFACAAFERAIWKQFWVAHSLDPRVQKETPISKEIDSQLYSVTELSVFFQALDQSEKIKILEESEKKIKNFDSSQNFGYFNVVHWENSENSGLYQEILDQYHRKEPKDFVEFLYFSCLSRVATDLDIAARKTLLCVIDSYSRKKAEDLLNEKTPETSAPPKPKKTKKKYCKKNNKNKNKKNNYNYKEIASEVLKDILAKLEKNLNAPTQSKDSGPYEDSKNFVKPKHFLAKKNYQRKNYNRNEQKQLKRPHSHKNLKTQVSNQSTPKDQISKTSSEVTPTKPAVACKKFQWGLPAQTVQTKLDTSEFPPLAVAPTTPDFSQLHHEIMRFCNSTNKKVEEKYMKFLPKLQKIFGDIRNVHSNSLTLAYGSYGSGLALESSDIDLVINLPMLPSRVKIQEFCKELCEELAKNPIVTECQAIVTAKVPVVKVKTESYLIDITYEDEDYSHQGVRTMNFTVNLLYLYPHLKELTLILKYFLYQNDLNSSYYGGISSYTLFIWIVACFNSIQYAEQDLGNLLLYFLDFYGNKFDPQTTGINIINGGSVYSLPCVCFENVVTVDPLTMENMTSNLFKITDLLKTFAAAYSKLKDIVDKPSSKNILKQLFNN